MRSAFVLRLGRRRWQVLPWSAVRCAVVSGLVVLGSLFAIDRIGLPMLEQRGLTAGDDWQRHNAIVVAEHRQKDTSEPLGKSVPVAHRFGVRSWTGHPVSTEKTAACRILVMGDSFVWGSPYLTLNHMWWRQLENELLSRGYDVEVVAAGQSGAATRDQLVVASRLIPQYKPDLIIWGYVTNDADEGLVKQISWSQQSLPGFNRIKGWVARVWPRLVAKFDALRSHKLAKAYTGPKYGYEYGEWELKLVEPENLTAYAKTVRGVKALMDEHQLPGFMLTLPNSPSTKQFTPRFDPILPVWRDTGIPAHNTLPAFVAQYGEAAMSGPESVRWGINPADGHPGPRACHFLGVQAADIVVRDFGSVIGTQQVHPPEPGIIINDWLPFAEHDKEPHADYDGFAWRMSYPDEARCPMMPLGIPTPLYAFKQPVALSRLSLVCPTLESIQIWVSCLDVGEGYDDGRWHDLGLHQGHKIVLMLPVELADRPISVIRFRATFTDDEHKLTWLFLPTSMEGK